MSNSTSPAYDLERKDSANSTIAIPPMLIQVPSIPRLFYATASVAIYGWFLTIASLLYVFDQYHFTLVG